jgi:Reverse transcriptase (RNA-dependent DNA polymerase)
MNGYRYYVLFIDDYSRFTWIYFLHSKDELSHVFSIFKAQVENLFQTTIKTIRTDGGTEYKPLSRLFPQIVHQITCPHTPQQNGLAERKHRHIVELALASIQHAAIPLTFWDEVFASMVYLINRLPSSLTKTVPYTTLFNTSPDYTHLRVIGCLCFPYIRPYNDHKLQPRSLPCVFLGYCHSQKGYKCFHIPTNKTFVSRHVLFDEGTFPFRMTSTDGSTTSSSPEHAVVPLASLFCTDAHSTFLDAMMPVPASASNTASLTPHPTVSPISPFLTTHNTPPPPYSCDHQTTSPEPTSGSPLVSSSHLHPMITRTRDNTRRPRQFPDHVTYLSTGPDIEPVTFHQANSSEHWRQAMAQEINALARNKTWILIPPPSHPNIVGCKWVYRIKKNVDGSIARYKARLVAKGFTQEEGVDYFETFSPVVRPTTIRLVISIAVQHGWSLRQLDVQNAFLHGDLHETVYMSQPPGFVDSNNPSHVCLLNKALYGLKQSPRAWFNTLSTALLAYGFLGSQYDPSLFIYSSHGKVAYLLIYVDDLILTGNNSLLLSDIILSLQSKFAVKDLGLLHYFLGIEVSPTSQGLLLTQSKYIMDLLHRANMHASKPSASPMIAHPPMSKTDGDPLDNPRLYRTIVGGLQYATITRPDIAYAVNKCSQFMHAPTTVHWAAVKRVLRYLNGSSTLGLHFTAHTLPSLHAYSDSDWAGCPDDRRSTTGFCIFYGSNLISWSSKKQPTVARSSTEAEYRSLATTGTELIWLQFLLKELQLPISSPPILWCDNIGATFLAANPMFHARTKHMEIDYHFIRERVLTNSLQVKFICSRDQLADLLTKPLSTPRFLLIRDKLTLVAPPFACGGANNKTMDTASTTSIGESIINSAQHNSSPEDVSP